MFYLNFLKDKYKMPYICDTPKDENHYHIYEEPQTTLQKNTHPILIGLKQDNKRGKGNQIGKEEKESLME